MSSAGGEAIFAEIEQHRGAVNGSSYVGRWFRRGWREQVVRYAQAARMCALLDAHRVYTRNLRAPPDKEAEEPRLI